MCVLSSSSGTGGRPAPLSLQCECMCVAPVLQALQCSHHLRYAPSMSLQNLLLSTYVMSFSCVQDAEHHVRRLRDLEQQVAANKQ